MIDTTMTAVPTGLPATGGAAVRLRACAPGAFTAPFQGTGLPVAVRSERPVAPTVLQPAPIASTDVPNTHGTTLGIHAPGRPES